MEYIQTHKQQTSLVTKTEWDWIENYGWKVLQNLLPAKDTTSEYTEK